ncbi:MAG TPA: hypothetical protein VF054_02290 [Micromonosporaceae bacterium]
MTGDDDRARHAEQTARDAGRRAAQARTRVDQITLRLRELQGVRDRVALAAEGPDRPPEPGQPDVDQAVARLAESADRARRAQQATIEAHLAAAHAHDSAAAAHEHAVDAGVGDIAFHERAAREHRDRAAADRHEADLLQRALREEFSNQD